LTLHTSSSTMSSTDSQTATRRDLEMVLHSLPLAPFTCSLMLSLDFEEQPIDGFHCKVVTALGCMFIILVVMHLVKRASQRENPCLLAIFHRLFTCADSSIMPALCPADPNAKAGSVPACMICCKAISFWHLIMGHLCLRPANKWTQRLLFAGSVPSSTASLDTCESHHDLGVPGQSVVTVQFVIVSPFTTLQLHSLTTHWGPRSKCRLKQKQQQEAIEDTHLTCVNQLAI
jgi:hypothetical protein